MNEKKIIQENATDEITGNIKKTYRSMYNAHNRLIAIYKLQKFSTIAISIYILAVSIIILNNNYFSIDKINVFNIYLIILSIISLTLSLTIGESGNKVLAENFQLCATELKHLYNTILMKIEQNSDYKLTNEEDLYHKILKKYKLRQNQIDYEYYRFEKYKSNNIKYIYVILFHIKYFIFTKLIYILLLLFPLLVMIIIQLSKK